MPTSPGKGSTSPEKIRFTITSCSGYDDDHPPDRLTSPDLDSTHKGWISQRFCLYPQQIILRLSGQSLIRVQRLQILVHHYKIPTRIDIFSAKLPSSNKPTLASSDPSAIDITLIPFTRLGYVSFSDNVDNGYRVRELKTVHLDVEATFLKLVIHKCHINSLNLYNQVGILGISILGTSTAVQTSESHLLLDPMLNMDDPDWASSEAVIRGLIEKSGLDKRVPETSDLVFSLSHDRDTIRVVESLEQAKRDAIKGERFEEAKTLKELVSVFKSLGGTIASLTLKKYEAIEKEDFDTAQKLKAEILLMKENGWKKLAIAGFRYDEDSGIRNIPKLLNESKHTHPMVSTLEPATNSPEKRHLSPVKVSKMDSKVIIDNIPAMAVNDIPTEKYEEAFVRSFQETVVEKVEPSTSTKRDENPQVESSEIRNIQQTGVIALQKREHAESSPLLMADQMDQYKHEIAIFGEDTMAKVLSKEFRFREAGIQEMIEFLNLPESTGTANVEGVARATFQILLFLTEDTREKTSLLSSTLWTKLFSLWAISSDLNEIWLKIAFEAIPVIMQRVSETNPRVKKAYFDLILKLAVMYHESPYTVLPVFLKLPKPAGRGTTVSPKVLKAHLEIFRNFLSTYGLEPTHPSGLKADKVIQFVNPLIEHTSPEIREEASRIAQIVSKLEGRHTDIAGTSGLNTKGLSPQSLTKRPLSSKQTKHDARLSQLKKSPSPIQIEALESMCIFCDRADPMFSEETLDEHYWSDCPMLMKCSFCQMFVEIPSYYMHLSTDCAMNESVRQCPGCKLPMAESEMESHSRNECHGPIRKGQSKCPLCRSDFTGLDAMRMHLIHPPGCKGNPRKPLRNK